MKPRSNCFAYEVLADGSKRCIALKDMYCKKKSCSFFKTKEQYAEDRRKYPHREGEDE